MLCGGNVLSHYVSYKYLSIWLTWSSSQQNCVPSFSTNIEQTTDLLDICHSEGLLILERLQARTSWQTFACLTIRLDLATPSTLGQSPTVVGPMDEVELRRLLFPCLHAL